MFEKDVDYIVSEDGKVKIVDEQTGRIMEGRRWSDGLHQAVEAKEHVKIEQTTQTFATITLQNYFRMYHKLSGMTGTAETEAGESSKGVLTRRTSPSLTPRRCIALIHPGKRACNSGSHWKRQSSEGS